MDQRMIDKFIPASFKPSASDVEDENS